LQKIEYDVTKFNTKFMEEDIFLKVEWASLIDTVPMLTYGHDFAVFKGIIKGHASQMPIQLDVRVGIFCIKGTIRAKCGKQTFTSTANTLTVLLDKRTLSYINSSEDFDGFSVVMSPKIFNDLIENLAQEKAILKNVKNNVVFSLTENQVKLVTSFYNTLTNTLLNENKEVDLIPIIRNLLRALYLNIASVLHKLPVKKVINVATRDIESDFYEQVKMYYKEKECHTVKGIANRLGLNPNYLSDEIKRKTGKNAKVIIEDFLIQAAIRLLTTTNKTIGDIALYIGFYTISSFCKFFKRHTGISPTEYRKKYRR
jgi:AraC-like DNA-binding protein